VYVNNRKCVGCLRGSTKCLTQTRKKVKKILSFLVAMEFIHLAVIVGLLVQGGSSSDVELSGPIDVAVKLGEEARISCDASVDIRFCSFISPWGQNMNMDPTVPYEGGRITDARGTDQKSCAVRISNVEEKDNGIWKCSVTAIVDGSGKEGKGEATVTVFRAPTAIKMFVDDAETTQLSLNLPDDSTKKIKCQAEGGRPAPSFSWMIGDQKMNGEIVDEEEVKNEDGTTIAAQTLTYNAMVDHNGMELTCTVNHQGYTDDQMNNNENKKSLTLDINYKPVAPVDETLSFYDMEAGKKFDIKIAFAAKPEPTDFHWKMHDQQGEVVGAGDSADGRYHAHAITKNKVEEGSLGLNPSSNTGPAEGYYTLMLTINEVKTEDSETSNTLVVKNDLGETEYKFTLGLGKKPDPPAASASPITPDSEQEPMKSDGAPQSGPIIAIVIVAIIIIVIIVVGVIARNKGMLCFADKNDGDDGEKSAAQFEALEKGEGSPHKEEKINDGGFQNESLPETETKPDPAPVTDNEEKKSNGSHTPV